MNTPIKQFNKPKIELLEEDQYERWSHSPKWFIKNGTTIMITVVAILVSLGWLIKYPDIITANALIVSETTPKLLTSVSSGKIDKLLVKNEQVITEGQYLAFVRSTARVEDVLSLKQWTDTIIKTFDSAPSQPLKLPIPILKSLGELQTTYEDVLVLFDEFELMHSSGYYREKEKSIEYDLNHLKKVHENALAQRDLVMQDYKLQETEFKAKESLLHDKVIAQVEFNQDKSKLLSKQNAVQQIDAQLINTTLIQNSKKTELLNFKKEGRDRQIQLFASVKGLRSSISDWLQKYALVSPCDGKVVFLRRWQEGQIIGIGEGMFYIQSTDNRLYCELAASQHGIGKVRIGQAVYVKIDGYPSAQFGHLVGQVVHIGSMPTKLDSFQIRVSLPHGLTTNQHKALRFANNLTGSSEIVTDSRRLIDRVLMNNFSRINLYQ